jgi:hypothetical protein
MEERKEKAQTQKKKKSEKATKENYGKLSIEEIESIKETAFRKRLKQ